MKISPMSATGTLVSTMAPGDAQPSMVQKIRSLRMNTNATPGRVLEEEQPDPSPVAAGAELTIPATNVDPTTPAAEVTQPLSPQLAALAKQRRALQVKEREIADREKALQNSSTSQADAVPLARLKSDPLGVLLETGVTYEQLTEAVLANQSGYNPEIRELKDKLAALEQGFEKKLADKDTQTEQAALDEMEREARQLSAQGEEFELVRETGGVKLVRDLIYRTYKKTGEVLDVKTALTAVEETLLEDNLKLANLKKIQGHITPLQPVSQPPQLQRQMRTLTNRDTASVPMDRKARALAAFRGTLKT